MSTKSLVLSLLDFRFEKKVGFVPLISALEGVRADEAAWQATVERMKEVCTNIQLTLSDWDENRFDTPYNNSDLSHKLLLADLAMHDAYHIGQILYIRKLYAARTNHL